ncbi:MAG: hypothetical protein Q9187_000802 [Circinaria calcarea]
MALTFWANFFYTQLFKPPPYPTTDFTGQTIIVTGSNIGLGFEAVRHFTRLNAEKVIMAVRSLEKGEVARKSIEESTGRKAVVEVWSLDLARYESVKEFAKKAETLKRLDAVVENAGIHGPDGHWEMSEDNESCITTNVVSTFLLAMLILPKLRETSARFNVTPRLAILTSELHFTTDLPERKFPSIFEALNDEKTSSAKVRYEVSKLLEVFYARELAARMTGNEKPNIIVNLVNPGFCYSGLIKNASLGIKVFRFFVARSTEEGSRTLVAAAGAGPESHGQYMTISQVAPPAPFVLSEEGAKTQQRVWTELSEKLKKIQPGIMKNV